jgi:hypothetical protein
MPNLFYFSFFAPNCLHATTKLLQELTVRRFTPPDAFRPFPNFFSGLVSMH